MCNVRVVRVWLCMCVGVMYVYTVCGVVVCMYVCGLLYGYGMCRVIVYVYMCGCTVCLLYMSC